MLEEINAFPGFGGGVRVGKTERVGDNTPDLMVGAGPGGGPHVRVYDGATINSPTLSPTVGFEFFAFSPGFAGGVFVAGTAIPSTTGSPLHLAGGAEASGDVVGVLEESDLGTIVSAAVARLEQAGLDSQAAQSLAQTPIIVRNLAPGLLGLADSGVIFIDDDAAGAGWFIDPTPLEDGEFAAGQNATELEALGRVDLLTVVLHELGHVLGLDDVSGDGAASDLMAETLPVGVRRLPDEDTLDALYADGELMDSILL
jgi:hypothetical protein